MSECKIGPSSASYIYTELWDHQGGDAVTFTIDAGQGGTVTLVTRYARQDDDPAYHQMILDMGQPTQKLIKIDCITSREFNSDSIKLADAAFAANGAHHLEL